MPTYTTSRSGGSKQSRAVMCVCSVIQDAEQRVEVVYRQWQQVEGQEACTSVSVKPHAEKCGSEHACVIVNNISMFKFK